MLWSLSVNFVTKCSKFCKIFGFLVCVEMGQWITETNHIGFADGANKVLYYNNPMWPGTLLSIPLVKLDYFSDSLLCQS